MAPNPKRNRCVILYDLNSKNQHQLRRALLKIYSFYYFRGSKDLVNLVLVNCEKTKNRKHQELGKGYKNIFEISHEELNYDPTFAHENIELKNANTACWKEALAVAIKILKEDKTAKIITYQILYLTDLSNSSKSNENIDDIVLELNENNIFLSIVGPDVKFPKTITSFEEVEHLVKDITFTNETEFLIEAKKLVEGCRNAVIANVKMGLQFFFNYKNPIGKQAWTVPLTVGSNIKYSVGTTKLTERCKGFKLKRKHQVSNPTIFVSALDNTKVYAQEDVRKGIVKHGKFIPLASNDMFKLKLDRVFSVVFVTKTENVPEYMMKGSACYTVAAAKNTSSAAFYSLLMRLDNAKSCLIAKRVYSKGSKPTYMVLLPVTAKKCFRAVQLPYGCELPFEWREEKTSKYKEEVPKEVEDFLDCLSINSNTCSLSCSMTPNLIKSSRGENLMNLAAAKLLHEPNLGLEEVDIDPFATGITADIGKELRKIWLSRGPVKIEEPVKEEESDDDADYF